MNTSQIKAYAPKARTDFINAITERAARLGIHKDHIEPMRFEGESRDVAIIGEQAVTKREGEQREKLVKRVNQWGFEMFIRSSAYGWFNRFVAIRYMELHDFLDHGYRVLSSPDGSANREDVLHPEIIDHAADVDLPGLDKEKVIELKLAGDQDNTLFRMLLIAQCNALHHAMPFLFEKVDNEEELLLPDNLLHTGSPLHNLITEVDEALWEDVEIIGWIYQFYISEKKDEVIGKQVKSEDIPAATQLFTPNWIVKYMVQNTLGRMWLATYPDSSLREKMEYYIEPARQEPDVQKELDATTPKEIDPETLTFLDPACGSGHILVEAYDILKEIYLERGYRTREIPRLILEKNLFGLDIDKRAAQLANFAVLMRARNDDRRLFSRDDLTSNILSITDTKGMDQERLNTALKNRESGSSGDTGFWKWERVQELLELFKEAKTFGSLISIPDDIAENLHALQILLNSSPQTTDDLFLGDAEKELDYLKPILDQAALLSKRYDCVVANPPYMGSKGMNPMLKTFAGNHYPQSKSDLFAIFIERNLELASKQGFVGMITMQSWMFLSSFEKLRDKILTQNTIHSMAHLGARGFDSIGGEVVSTTAFVLGNTPLPKLKGSYFRLIEGHSEKEKLTAIKEAIQNPDCGWFFNASADDFKKIPGSPVAYWVTQQTIKCFFENTAFINFTPPKKGIDTGKNDLFLRFWYEVDKYKTNFPFTNADINELKHWHRYNKGGAFRKWFGNNDYVVNWSDNGAAIKNFKGSTIRNEKYFKKNCLTWSDVTSSQFSARYSGQGAIHDNSGPCAFGEKIR
ncbi:BREX-1 system adenine-specific DNA-methyltransferase PglX, partial [Desulfamplus magnetovallimortis]|uniref:BREX-1 system adenine-specific DNA-methyltransferase PglX n=1 Tax=Desulfamplus magnetovallimortis TaxID=1246637 RepID=UPI001118872A